MEHDEGSGPPEARTVMRSRALVVVGLLQLALAGCAGELTEPAGRGAPGGGGLPTPEECAEAEPTPGATPLRRLSHAEYRNAVRDVFPGVELPAVELAADDTRDGFENDADLNSATPLLVANYESAASELARALTEQRDGWLDCGESCAEALVDEVALRLLRRPMDAESREAYLGLFASQREAIDREAAIELTLYAMLQSPEFLYRLETSAAGAPGEVVPLDGWEIASRMSFLTLGSGPDEGLRARVDELHSPDVREEEARRLLETPGAMRQWSNFARQWLDLDRIQSQAKAPDQFPDWTDTLQRSMHEESFRFVSHVMERDGTLSALLLSREAPVDAHLAEFYGVEPPQSGWEVRELPEDERAGILTRGSFLASHAHAGNASPILRGVAILEHWVCYELGAPPDDIDTSNPASGQTEPRTNRELFEERTSPAACQGCHTHIDGIGFGFENYDSTGAYRVEDNGFSVDASGRIETESGVHTYEGAVELSQILAESDTVRACVTSKWAQFALGRHAEPADACRNVALTERFRESGGDFRELLVAMVRRPDFIQRTVTAE